jgi:hypothetical protein
MQNNRNYAELSASDLREMLLNDMLDVNLMGLEEYEKMFGHEIDLDEPNPVVLNFCNMGLKQYEEYAEDVSKPSYKNMLRNHKSRHRNIKPVYRIARQAAMIVLIVAIAMIEVQGIAYAAFKINLFEYIYNWFKHDEAVIITVDELDGDGEHDLSNADNYDAVDDEFMFVQYDNIESVDKVWLGLVSPYLLREYVFDGGSYAKDEFGEIFKVFFLDSVDNVVSIDIQNSLMVYVEKENEGFIKEIVVNGIEFTIFKNMDDYHVLWEYGGYSYKLNAFLSFEEVEKIVLNYY